MERLKSKSEQGGSMMLEALISILIFSIGVIGLIGMQASAVSATSDAQYRSAAGFLADQMVGLAWAGKISAFNPVSNVIAYTPDVNMVCNSAQPCANNSNLNVVAWASAVSASLPSASGSIAVNGSLVTVTVSWLPPNLPASSPVHRHVAATFIN